jgi:hypothetical protein
MQVGRLKQKAHPYLVGFVFCCILVTTGLLYILEESEAKADDFIASYAQASGSLD